MGQIRLWVCAGVLCLLCAGAMYAQQDQTTGNGSAANSSAVAAVPRLIKFSGAVTDRRGEPLGNVAVRLTFSVYEEQTGGAALWIESQVAQLDELGHYTVLLGATRADGLPVELFPAGKARWLGVQVEGRDEDARVLLVSVPYALKAEDAAMLGGRSAADFVLGEQLKEEVKTQVAAQTPGIATQAVEMLVNNPPKAPAIAEGPSAFACATAGDCVAVTQSGTGRALRPTATSASEAVLVQQNGTGYGLRALAAGNVGLYGQITGSAGTSYGVKGLTTSTTGAGVFGYNQGTTGLAYGIYGQTSSTEGTALFGRATSATGATIGLRGHADSTSGTGITGQATATSGTTTGILGRVFSAAGTALVVDNTQGGKLLSGKVSSLEKFSVSGSGNVVASGSVTAASFSGDGSGLTNLNASYLYGAVSTTSSAAGVPGVTGTNTAGTGDTNGVYGEAASTEGTGVYGYASAGTGYTNGVYGSADSTDGTGVFGYASSATGLTDGVYGGAASTDGAGVYGYAAADTGETYGLYGEVESTSGTGVMGYALSATGTTVGVTGMAGSSAGVAGLFDNLAGGNILLGQTNGTERFRVDGSGNVSANGSVTASSFVGPLTGAASDLNCAGCVAPAEVSFNYAGSASQGGAATSALAADAATTAANATNLGGVAASNFARLDIGNSFTGNQSIAGNLTVTTTGGGFKVEGNATSPNVIAGYSGNSLTGGVVGATLAGGGSSGSQNRVTDNYGTVGGGVNNQVGDNAGTVSDHPGATVAGGSGNTASGSGDSVGGGAYNTASGDYATIAGGYGNTASGNSATVPGGMANTAGATYSFAAGNRAKANHQGAFVWGDSTDADITSSAADQFIARAVGGVAFYTSTDLSTGVTVAAGGGSWSTVSDRNAKQNFAPVDGAGLLARLASLPVLTWNYKAQDASIRHLGPMAQDFYAAFQVGEDDKHIATVDADGVALVGVQALYQLSQEKDRVIKAQGEEIKQLSQQLEELRARLARLEQAVLTR